MAEKPEWPDAHIPTCEPVRINAANARDRIDDAIHTIIGCWDEWDAFSQQEEQQSQDPDEWLDSMRAQLSAVLVGMVFDPDVMAHRDGVT